MLRITLMLLALASLSACAAQGELTSPCACAEMPINPDAGMTS